MLISLLGGALRGPGLRDGEIIDSSLLLVLLGVLTLRVV